MHACLNTPPFSRSPKKYCSVAASLEPHLFKSCGVHNLYPAGVFKNLSARAIMDLISSSLATSLKMDHDKEFKYNEPSNSSVMDNLSLKVPTYL